MKHPKTIYIVHSKYIGTMTYIIRPQGVDYAEYVLKEVHGVKLKEGVKNE